MMLGLIRIGAVLALGFVLVGLLSVCDGGSNGQFMPPTEPPTELPKEPRSESPADNAVTIYGDNINGKEWLQPADFTGYRYDQVSAVCPPPAGACSGSLQGDTFDLTGYKWASIEDITTLFNAYDVDPDFSAPFQTRGDDEAAIAMSRDFAISGDWCFGDCPYGIDLVIGMVRDEAPAGTQPYLPYAEMGDCVEWPIDCVFSNTIGFEPDEVQPPDDGIGVWFWKPADRVIRDGKEWIWYGTTLDITYEDVEADCPGSPCTSGTVAGYTWASIDDVMGLFNSYGISPPFTAPFQERSDQSSATDIYRHFPTGGIGGDYEVAKYISIMVSDPPPEGQPFYLAGSIEGHFWSVIPFDSENRGFLYEGYPWFVYFWREVDEQ